VRACVLRNFMNQWHFATYLNAVNSTTSTHSVRHVSAMTMDKDFIRGIGSRNVKGHIYIYVRQECGYVYKCVCTRFWTRSSFTHCPMRGQSRYIQRHYNSVITANLSYMKERGEVTKYEYNNKGYVYIFYYLCMYCYVILTWTFLDTFSFLLFFD